MALVTPSAASLKKLFRERRFLPTHSMERQVCDHVREMIETGALPPQTRLPGIRELARVWNTNYCTVRAALSRLTREGLLHQAPRLGTFVATREKVLRKVLLAHCGNLTFRSAAEFLGLMHMHLYQQLCIRGVHTVSHFDQRPPGERETIPEEVAGQLRSGQLDAVIFTHGDLPWRNRLALPWIQANRLTQESGADWDVEGFATLAVNEAQRHGCRRLALVVKETPLRRLHQPMLADTLRERAGAAGIEVLLPPDEAEDKPLSVAETGYRQCRAALALRPDGLVVVPDTCMKGAVAALVERRIAIPRELMVVSHRNREMSVFAPFPVSWITCAVADFAAAALAQIEAALKGEPPSFRKLPVTLEPPAEGSAP